MMYLITKVYMDRWRCWCLAKSGQGCHVGKMFTGCLAYADDVVLLSPTSDALENMLKICEKYSVDFSIKFNTSKSKLLVFSENPTDVKVNFQGNIIPQVKIDWRKLHKKQHVSAFFGKSVLKCHLT